MGGAGHVNAGVPGDPGSTVGGVPGVPDVPGMTVSGMPGPPGITTGGVPDVPGVPGITVSDVPGVPGNGRQRVADFTLPIARGLATCAAFAMLARSGRIGFCTVISICVPLSSSTSLA